MGQPWLEARLYKLKNTYGSVWSHQNSTRTRCRSLERRWHDVPVAFWFACLWPKTVVTVQSTWPNAGRLHNWVTDAPGARLRFLQLRVRAWKKMISLEIIDTLWVLTLNGKGGESTIFYYNCIEVVKKLLPPPSDFCSGSVPAIRNILCQYGYYIILSRNIIQLIK